MRARQVLLVATIVIGTVGVLVASALEPTADPVGTAVRVGPFVVVFAATAWVAWRPLGRRAHRTRTIALASLGGALLVAGASLRLGAPEIRFADTAIAPGLAALAFGVVGGLVGPVPPSQRSDRDDRSTLALVLAVLGLLGLSPLAVPAIVVGTRTRGRLPEAHPGRTVALVAVILGWVVTASVLAVVLLAVVAALTLG